LTAALPAHVPLDRVQARLPVIFPLGTPNRAYLVRDIAARTVFVALYVGAVEGADRWFRPNQVTRMTDAQAARTSDDERITWSRDPECLLVHAGALWRERERRTLADVWRTRGG
jgi:hypothetical protein